MCQGVLHETKLSSEVAKTSFEDALVTATLAYREDCALLMNPSLIRQANHPRYKVTEYT